MGTDVVNSEIENHNETRDEKMTKLQGYAMGSFLSKDVNNGKTQLF